MLYDSSPDGGGIEVCFENDAEVEAVREAFREHNAHLESLGNDSSVSDYQRYVADWEGSPHRYRGSSISQLIEKLRFFSGATDERIEELMDDQDNPDRLEAVKARYRTGTQVMSMVSQLELYDEMDDELSELLGDET